MRELVSSSVVVAHWWGEDEEPDTPSKASFKGRNVLGEELAATEWKSNLNNVPGSKHYEYLEVVPNQKGSEHYIDDDQNQESAANTETAAGTSPGAKVPSLTQRKLSSRRTSAFEGKPQRKLSSGSRKIGGGSRRSLGAAHRDRSATVSTPAAPTARS